MDTGADRRDQAVDDRRGYDSGEGISSQVKIRLINELGGVTDEVVTEDTEFDIEVLSGHFTIYLVNETLVLDASPQL